MCTGVRASVCVAQSFIESVFALVTKLPTIYIRSVHTFPGIASYSVSAKSVCLCVNCKMKL